MGLKPAPKLWYQHRGLELWQVAKEERGKPSLRLVAATGADGRGGAGMNPSGLGVLDASRGLRGPWWGEDTAASCGMGTSVGRVSWMLW